MDCLLESEQELKDYYYQKLRDKGSLDYIDQIITPEEKENGIRLDTELNYPLTIRTNSITCVNYRSILGQIKCLSKIVS